MAWNPRYNLISVEAFIDNLVTVFERDADEAIAFYQGDATLPSFSGNIRTARAAGGPWPALNLLPAGDDPVETDDAALIEGRPRVIVEVETVGRVPGNLARYLIRYVTAVKSILYEMTPDDLRGEIPRAGMALKGKEVTSERYAERFYESEKLYTQVGSVILTILCDQGLRST